MNDWYSIVQFGTYADCPRAPHGPWRGEDRAFAALDRHLRRLGSEAGSFAAATSVRVVGPYRTREEAQDADISMATRIAHRA